MNEVNFAIHRVSDSGNELFRHAHVMQFSRNGNMKSYAVHWKKKLETKKKTTMQITMHFV